MIEFSSSSNNSSFNSNNHNSNSCCSNSRQHLFNNNSLFKTSQDNLPTRITLHNNNQMAIIISTTHHTFQVLNHHQRIWCYLLKFLSNKRIHSRAYHLTLNTCSSNEKKKGIILYIHILQLFNQYLHLWGSWLLLSRLLMFAFFLYESNYSIIVSLF